MKKIIIAVDGYSSCGKSTMAKSLARKIGYVYIDSGAMYRACTLFYLRKGIIRNGKFNTEEVIQTLQQIRLEFRVNPDTGLSEIYLNGQNVEKEIRGMDVASSVSSISAIPEVRQSIVALQRSYGREKGIIMDGRDIGSNVFPNAELKIFMTAREEIRARRRYEELQLKNMPVSMEDVRSNLALRDHEDTHRKHNPLIQAPDALVLDNSELSPEEQLNKAYQWFLGRMNC